MEEGDAVGSAVCRPEETQPATDPRADRLSSANPQRVDQAQDGSWVVLFTDGLWQEYSDYHHAIRWIDADPGCRVGRFYDCVS